MLLLFVEANAETIFTIRSGESDDDRRMDYPQELFKLALEKTVLTYGSYKLVKAPIGPNMKRSLQNIKNKTYPNYFLRQSASSENLKGYRYVPFPIDLGIVGYRVAFTSAQVRHDLRKVENLQGLRSFSLVQGVGWLDTEIFSNYGFKVNVSASYEGMFRIVARGRIDLFFRGANEVLEEWGTRKDIDGLVLDDNIVVYYPLPRFFITHLDNEDAAKRIHDGLLLAYEDGSLRKLWDEYYGASIDFSKLGERKIFKLKNPYLEGIDRTFMKYIYDPFNP